MDPNSNFNQSLNGSYDLSNASSLNFSNASSLSLSGGYPGGQLLGSPGGAANFQHMSREDLVRMQQINQQQIQQLAAQMAQMQVQQGPVMAPTTQVQFPAQMYIPNAMDSPTSTRHVFPATVAPLGTTSVGAFTPPVTGLQFSPNGNVPNLLTNNLNNSSAYAPTAYPNNYVGINGQLHTQANALGQLTTGQPRVSERNISTPNSLPLTYTNAPPSPRDYPNSPRDHRNSPRNHPSNQHVGPQSSTPQLSPAIANKAASDASDGPVFMNRPRQQMSAQPPAINAAFSPHSDRSSVSSTTSSSPVSTDHATMSPDSSFSEPSEPRSPEANMRQRADGDLRSPIQNNPLQFKTRFPQDKCYSCMKKVYKVESIGPVKGVVYHKGCFRCKACQTQLTMKNFNHSQSDSFDLAVYCKSHQPTTSVKSPKLDSESFEIKSALSAPKKDHVRPLSERVPVHNYNLDMHSREIEHARKVPVQNLQGGVQVRATAWSKSKREQAPTRPANTVRYDDPVPEVDQEGYIKLQVENTPDY